MTFKFLTSAAAAALVASSALAGSITPPPADPVFPVAAPAGPDWTGFYAGSQLGYADVDSNTLGVNGEGVIGGFIIGYDYDFGPTVTGIGIDYDWTDMTVAPGIKAENVWRVKLRSGIKQGNGLVYFNSGYAEVNTNAFGTDDGVFYGGGYSHIISDSFSVGGELLFHHFSNVGGSGVSLDATTLQFNGAYRF